MLRLEQHDTDYKGLVQRWLSATPLKGHGSDESHLLEQQPKQGGVELSWKLARNFPLTRMFRYFRLIHSQRRVVPRCQPAFWPF